MRKLVLLLLYEGIIKLAEGVCLRELAIDSRLNLTLFGCIERYVEVYKYVCQYMKYVYSKFI